VRAGLAAHDPALVRVGLTASLMASSTYVQMNGLVNSVVALAAYRYAEAGQDDLFPGDRSYGERAFVRAG
jgi:hypothetical protein